METILLISLITWGLTRYAGTELIATARGTEPPRLRDRQRRAERAHERRMARENRRTGPTIGDAIAQRIAERIAHPRGPREAGPARKAMGEWWNDAWGYATERRHQRHQRHADGDLLRQRLARKLRDRFGHTRDNQWRPRPRTQEPGRRSEPSEPVIIDVEPTTDQPDHTEPTPASPADGPATPNAPVEEEEEDQTPPEDPPQKPDHESTPPTSDTDPNPAADHQPTATVHPIRKDTPMTGANPNLTSGETLDPGSAHHFCTQMQNVGQRLLNEIEQSIASLSRAGVSGEPIRLLEQMRENASLFATSAGEASSHFARHLNTQDQVLNDDTLAGTVNGTYMGTRS